MDPGFAVISDPVRVSQCGALRHHVWVNFQYRYVRLWDQFSVQFNTNGLIAHLNTPLRERVFDITVTEAESVVDVDLQRN